MSDTKIMIGGLSYNTTEEGLKDYFSRFGEVVEAEVVKDDTGRSRGIGFVDFREPSAAASALVIKTFEFEGRREYFSGSARTSKHQRVSPMSFRRW